MSTDLMEQEARPAADVEQKIRALDSRLEDLRTRRRSAETELTRLSKEENRLIRIFAEADGKEKTEIRGRVDVIARERSDREKDMAGLAAAIAEAEAERTASLPAYESAWKLRAAQERKKKLEDLRLAHERDRLQVQNCEKALQEALDAEGRSRFAWTTFKDQLFLEEQNAILEAHKMEWQRRSGPFAPANLRR